MEVKLYDYDNILLRLFFEISNEGNFEKLVIFGHASLDQCLERWEQIVKRNEEENSSFKYQSYFSLYQGYNLLLAQHTTIKLLLLRASIKFDEEVNEELSQRGFKLNIEGETTQERSLNYAKSIEEATRRSNAIVTKINMKKSEIERYFAQNKEKKQTSIEDIIADLEVSLGDGRNIPDDITLAKFNSLKKVAKRKQDALKRLGKSGKK